MSDICEFSLRHFRRKALYNVVTRVHFHHQRSLSPDGLCEISRVRAISCPHLNEASARPLHDVWDTKCATDLDELAA